MDGYSLEKRTKLCYAMQGSIQKEKHLHEMLHFLQSGASFFTQLYVLCCEKKIKNHQKF